MDGVRAVVRAAPDLYVLLAPDLTVVEASDACLRALSTTRDHVIGRRAAEVLPADPALDASLARVVAEHHAEALSVAGWNAHNAPVLGDDDQLLFVMVRFERLDAASRLTADLLRSAVDSIQDAFALFDADDRLVVCNSVYRRLVHEPSPGALVGKRFADILDGWIDDIEFADANEEAKFREARFERRSHEVTSTFDVRLRNGRSLRITDRRTAEGGMVKTIWDVTEDERRAAELHEARAVAEAASNAKSEFLSSMSHELRTPLNAILGFAQLLLRDKRDPLSPRQRERAEHITSGGEHLLRLINDVLDLSKIESGVISISPEAVELAAALVELTPTLAPIAAKQGIEFEILPVPAGMPMVVADRTRFLQILMNYGSNALKYNRPGGSARFEVSQPTPGRVRVTVIDTGIGIPLERQDKLFQAFQRAGQETGPIEGTGIGLLITKRLAALMNGSVGFHSVAGVGSEFWVELPAYVAVAAMPSSPASHDRAITPPQTATRHLLLYVEDNPANVNFMRDLLGSVDHVELVTVPTAELGIQLASARHPDVIVMDINLPGMSGLDALRALQASEETRQIPIIALTAAASERDRQHGVEAGFYRYLGKPVDVDELIAAIESALQK